MDTLRWYFLSAFFALGAVWPLLGLAFAARGFSPSEYAWLLALLPLARLLAAPLWGALADARFGSVVLLRVNSWLSALAMLALALCDGPLASVAWFALWALVGSSLTPLIEASTYTLLGTRALAFGYVRVFGSIGYAVSAFSTSLLAAGRVAMVPFVLAAVGYALAGAVAQRLPAEVRAPTQARPTWRALSLRIDLVLLWIASTLYSAAHGAFDMYFGPYVGTLRGVPTAIVGTAWGVGVSCEVVLIWFMPRVLAGRAAALVLPSSALVAALRWWLLAHVTSAAGVLLLAPLHGITYGAWYLAYVHETQAAAAPELRATVQGVAAACQGLGFISATVLGGYGFERWGGRHLYEVAALVSLAAFSLYLARLLVRRRAPLSPRVLSRQA